jgi:hypothetical protein
MPRSSFSAPARALAARLSSGTQHTLDNAALRTIFGVSRVTAVQRQAIVRAIKRADLEIVSGAKTEPLVVRKHALQNTADTEPVVVREHAIQYTPGPTRAAVDRPWFKRKRVWVFAAVLFFVLVGVVGSAFDSVDDTQPQDAAVTATQTVPAEAAVAGTATETTTSPAARSTRSDAEDMVDDDLYAEALTAAALLGNDDESYIARRIANRLARRTLFALDGGDRSRARFLLRKSQDYPTTSMSRQASAAYEAAQARAKVRTAARKAVAEQRAAREAEQRAASQAEQRAADAVPDAPDATAPDASGPSTNNWCGKRDGDGDGIYCE